MSDESFKRRLARLEVARRRWLIANAPPRPFVEQDRVTSEEALGAYAWLCAEDHNGLEVVMSRDVHQAAKEYVAIMRGAPIRTRITDSAMTVIEQLQRHGITVGTDPDSKDPPRETIRSAILERNLAGVIFGRSPDGKPELFEDAFVRVFREPLSYGVE